LRVLKRKVVAFENNIFDLFIGQLSGWDCVDNLTSNLSNNHKLNCEKMFQAFDGQE
jgi:hypothetical protein